MTAPTPAPPDVPRPGDVIAEKYEVESVLGAGGMGVVVAARHTALRQRVAVKFLLPAAARLPEASARFLREARAAVAIQSEHVARVLDVGKLPNDAPYIVMEHLTGSDLGRVIKARGPLPIDEALDFLLQALEAIAEAHALGIIHRDLKPANLFLTHRLDGSPLVKVLDFGLSKVTVQDVDAPEGSLTASSVVVGSPHYMSPEQVRSLKHVDERTDVWALGVILYELLTATRPFDGPSLTAICVSVATDHPTPMAARRPDLPAPLDAVVASCLEKDPANRLRTVAALANGLAPFAPQRAWASLERINRLLPGEATVPLPAAVRPEASSHPAPGHPSAPTVPLASPGPLRTTAPASEPTTVPITLGEASSPLSPPRSLQRRKPFAIAAGLVGAALLSAGMLAWTRSASRTDHNRPGTEDARGSPTGQAPVASGAAGSTVEARAVAVPSAQPRVSAAPSQIAEVTASVVTAPAPLVVPTGSARMHGAHPAGDAPSRAKPAASKASSSPKGWPAAATSTTAIPPPPKPSVRLIDRPD